MSILKNVLSNANFWTALIGVVGAVAAGFGMPSASIQQITAIISAASVLIASILGYNMQAAATVKAQAQIEAARAVKQ